MIFHFNNDLLLKNNTMPHLAMLLNPFPRRGFLAHLGSGPLPQAGVRQGRDVFWQGAQGGVRLSLITASPHYLVPITCFIFNPDVAR